MERIGDAVRGSLHRAGVPDVGVLADVTRVWPTTVGAVIAAAAWPARTTRDGSLLVHTSSSVWAAELTALRREIGDKLTASLGTPAPRLRFAPGPVPSPAAETVTGEVADRPQPSPEVTAIAAAIAGDVEDAELRALVHRAAAASLSRPADSHPF